MHCNARKLQILKHKCFIYIFNLAAQKIWTISTFSEWQPNISVINSVSDQSWNTVTYFPSGLEKWIIELDEIK